MRVRNDGLSLYNNVNLPQLADTSLFFDLAQTVVRRDAEVGHRSRGDLALDRAEALFRPDRRAEHVEVGDFRLDAEETLREVAAVRADALVRLAPVVVVPVEQGGRRAGRERQRVHRDGAGDVDFAGARHQPFAQHAHRQAGGAAVVVLHAGPALNGAGVALVFLDPAIDGERELGLLDDVLLPDVRRDAPVAGDLVELRLDFRRVAVDRLRGAEDLGEVDGDDGDARSLQDLLAEAHRLEGAGARADAADARVLQALDGAADAREAVEVGGEFVAGDVGGVRRRVGEVKTNDPNRASP